MRYNAPMANGKSWLLSIATGTLANILAALVTSSFVIAWAQGYLVEGQWTLDNILPPGFLLILSVLSAPTLAYHTFYLPIRKYYQRKEYKRLRRERKKKEHLKRLVTDAYQQLRLVRTPALMRANQDPPPNLVFMEEEALVALRRLAHELWRRRGGVGDQGHPAIEWEVSAGTGDRLRNKDDWHIYLAGEHARLSGEE